MLPLKIDYIIVLHKSYLNTAMKHMLADALTFTKVGFKIYLNRKTLETEACRI